MLRSIPGASAVKDWLLLGNRLPLLIIGLLSLWILIFPAVDYKLRQERIHGDPAQYFAYLQSVFEDGDISFADDYRELDPGIPPYHYRTLPTGYAPQMFAVGAPLLWSPFYLTGKLFASLCSVSDRQQELTLLLRFTRFGSRAYGAAALFLIFFFLRRFFSAHASLLATLGVFFCTPFFYYSFYEVIDSHAAGAFSVALFLWYASRTGPERKTGCWFVLGLLLGLVALVRWQNAVVAFWLLVEQGPAIWKALAERRGLLEKAGKYALLAVSSFAVFSIQLAIWTVIFGPFKTPLAYGANHVIWERPEIINLLFSSRHGLFSWHPLAYIAVIGLVIWIFDRKGPAAAAMIAFLSMLYLNSITGDWWAGDSFGMRRFVSLAPIFALGAACLAGLATKPRRRFLTAATWLLTVVLALWNVSLSVRFHEAEIPHDEATGMGILIGGGIGDLVDATFWPFSFPGNLIQSLQTDNASCKDADWICATQVRSLQNSLEGDISAGYPSFRDGFGAPVEIDGTMFRELADKGNVYFSVFTELPRSSLTINARVVGEDLKSWEIPVVEVIVNGNSLRPLVGADERGNLKRKDTLIPIPAWRFGINKLELKLWIGRKAKEGKYRLRRYTIAGDSALKPGKGRYSLLVSGIKIEDYVQTAANE